jgi:16S rRNA (uracil1498-N3)-methyltransferase
MKDGDPVFVGDGAGHRISGILSGREVHVSGSVEARPEPDLRLFCAIPEPARFDWMLQKCTELGATDFFPLLCERSERQSVRMDRSAKIIEEAAVQSGRYVLPRVHEPLSLSRALEITKKPAFLLTPGAENWLAGSGSADFWIGPEGGFSAAEQSQMSALVVVSISHHILRVETAAAAALARYSGPGETK